MNFMTLFSLYLLLSYKVASTTLILWSSGTNVLYLEFSLSLRMHFKKSSSLPIFRSSCQTEFVKLTGETEWAGAISPCFQTRVAHAALNNALHISLPTKRTISIPFSSATTPTISPHHWQIHFTPLLPAGHEHQPLEKGFFLFLLKEAVRTEMGWHIWKANKNVSPSQGRTVTLPGCVIFTVVAALALAPFW